MAISTICVHRCQENCPRLKVCRSMESANYSRDKMTARRSHREDSPNNDDRFPQSPRNGSETDDAYENSDIFLVAGLLFLHRLLLERSNGRVHPSLPFLKSGIHPATTHAVENDHEESSTPADDRLSRLCQHMSADTRDRRSAIENSSNGSSSLFTSRSESWNNWRSVRKDDRAKRGTIDGDRSSKETLDSDREFANLAGIAGDVLEASRAEVVGRASNADARFNSAPKLNCEKSEYTVGRSCNESRSDCPVSASSGKKVGSGNNEISIDDSDVEAEVMAGEGVGASNDPMRIPLGVEVGVESGKKQKNPVTLLLVTAPKTMLNLLSRKRVPQKSNETSKDDSELQTPRSVQGKRKRLASVLLRLLRGKGSQSNASISCEDSKRRSDTSQEQREIRKHLRLQIEDSPRDRLATNRLAGSRTSKPHHHAREDVSLREDQHDGKGLCSMLKPNPSSSKCNGYHLATETTGNHDESMTMQSIATVSKAKNRASNWITEVQEKVIPLRYSEASPRISIEQDLHVRTLLSSSNEVVNGSSEMLPLQSDHRNPTHTNMSKPVRISSKTKRTAGTLVSQRWSKHDRNKFPRKSYSYRTNRAGSTDSSTSFDTKDMLGLLVGSFLENRVPRSTWHGLPKLIGNTCSQTLNIEECRYAKLQGNTIGAERSALDILLYHISTSTCTRCALSPEKTRLIRSNKGTRQRTMVRQQLSKISVCSSSGSSDDHEFTD